MKGKNMNKKMRRAAAAIICALIVVLGAVPAFAATYTPVKGDAEHGFTQFLIIDKDACIPDIEFNYSIAPGQPSAASAGKMAVLAGVGAPAIGRATFVQGEAAGTAAAEGLTLAADEQYAQKAVKFDFSGVSFAEPGIYRYVVTMTSAAQLAVEYDIQKGTAAQEKVRILDVYVVDDNGSLKVDSYAFHETANAVAAGAQGGSADVGTAHAALADKSAGFVNRYDTQELVFGKEVTGNQGSRDKYFKFSLSIGSAAPDTVYHVDLSSAEAASGATAATADANRNKTNPVKLTTDANGAASADFFLCDGQYVTLKGLPKGASYVLTEDKEDYISADGISAQLGKGGEAYSDPVRGNIEAKDIATGFTNTRNGVVPTGLISVVAPGAGAAALGIAGLGIVLFGRKRRNEEEELGE